MELAKNQTATHAAPVEGVVMSKAYQGVLRELGEAEAGQRTRTMNYTYLEVGEQMIKNAKVFKGLDSKLNHALGQQITLYVDGNFVVAITTQDGKTFSSERFGFFSLLVAWALVVAGLAFSVVLIGIPFAILGGYLLYVMSKANAGANLPNAIQIPT